MKTHPVLLPGLLLLILALSAACANSQSDLPPAQEGNNDVNNAVNNDAPNNDPDDDINNDSNNDLPNNDPNNAPNNDPNNDVPDPCEGIQDCQPGSALDYDFQVPASVVTSVIVETDPTQGADLDGDGQPDNALGALLSDLSRLLAVLDVNEQYAATIADGRLSLGLAWPILADEVVTENQGLDGVMVHFLDLDDLDNNPNTRDGYRVGGASFIPGTSTPRVRAEGSIEALIFSGGGLDGFFVPFPIGAVALRVNVDQMEVTGAVEQGEGGVSLTDGVITGAFSVEKLIGVLNEYLMSSECACLGLEEPVLGLEGCLGQVDGAQCSGEAAICASLASSCALLGEILGRNADVDLIPDPEDTPDSISVMIRFEASPTSLQGVNPAP